MVPDCYAYISFTRLIIIDLFTGAVSLSLLTFAIGCFAYLRHRRIINRDYAFSILQQKPYLEDEYDDDDKEVKGNNIAVLDAFNASSAKLAEPIKKP